MTRIAVLQMTGGVDPVANARVLADAVRAAKTRGELHTRIASAHNDDLMSHCTH